MRNLLIIKLGGSVITFKDNPCPKANHIIIRSLAKDIAKIYQQGKYKIILVHGAGSFAHPLVKKYKLNSRLESKTQKIALTLVHKQLQQLNNLILDALIKNKIPTATFSPHSFIIQNKGQLTGFDYTLIKKALEIHFIPILFGDMVFDGSYGYSVISGDVIAAYLAKKLKADQVIFLSDVDGIYDNDPKENSKAKIIPLVTNKNLKEVIAKLTKSGRIDVTAEMKGKIISLQQNLKNIPVVIANGLKAQILQKVLTQDSVGTKLLLN